MKIIRAAALLCAACLTPSAVGLQEPAAVFAAEPAQNEFDGLLYEIEDGAVTITGYTADLAETFAVPTEIEGKPVTKIAAGAFSYHTTLVSVTISEGITEIGEQAFRACKLLKMIELPESLKTVPREMCEECRQLESVSFSEQTETIGDLAFAKCEMLEQIEIPESVTEIGEEAFTGTPWLTARRAESPFVIVNRILIDGKTCKGDITIPAEAEIIGAGAFSYNYVLVNVVIPAHVKKVCRYGFYYCPSMKYVTILNPDCEIYDLDGTFSNAYGQNINARHVAMLVNGAIRGYENSTAQEYAEKHNYPFEVFDPSELPQGDCNGSGLIEIDDAQILLNDYVSRVAGYESELTDLQRTRCDVNGDAAADITDAQYILQYYVRAIILGIPVTWEELTA